MIGNHEKRPAEDVDNASGDPDIAEFIRVGDVRDDLEWELRRLGDWRAEVEAIADAMRRAVNFDLADAVRRAQQFDQAHPDRRIGLSRAADLAEVSRPTAYKLLEQARSGPDHSSDRTVDNATIARWHAGYGYGYGHEAVDTEFWRRFPRLEGWFAAARYLSEQHRARWEAEHSDATPMDGPDDSAPGYDQLRVNYREAVDRIAASKPARKLQEPMP